MKNLKNSIIYNVYPTSFYDSNGDGIGDLNGITEKLPYIKQFADIVWINPFFTSPFCDGGYDVEDYLSVDSRIGALSDLEKLLVRAKELELKVLLDLVIGHTSEKHKWFTESKRQEKNKYSDYYIWTDDVFAECPYPLMRGGGDRNGGYMTNFFYVQPSLNFGFSQKNYDWQKKYDDASLVPLHNEFLEIMRFYLKMGVSGFRVDMAASIVKDDISGECCAQVWQKLFGVIRKEYPDAIFVSEWGVPEKAVKHAGFDIDFLTHCHSEGYNNLFRAESGTNVFKSEGNSFFRKEALGEADTFFEYFQKNLDAVIEHGYICVPSGNHDLPRVAKMRTDDELKCVFAFLFCLPCVPLIYYGDEIGMNQLDCKTKDGGYNRTGARTPMQWDDSKNSGFSTADKSELYLPIDENFYKKKNVSTQTGDNNSILNLVKELASLKKSNSMFSTDCSFKVVQKTYPIIVERGDGKLTCFINPSSKTFEFDVSGSLFLSGNAELISNKLTLKACSFAYVVK